MNHTPGPWRWEFNATSKMVSLVGGKPTFDKTVMDFVRYGMGRAAPAFNDLIAGNQYNIMERCEKYAVPVAGREHHASWFQDLNHPDARLIAAAPTLAAACRAIDADIERMGSVSAESVDLVRAALKLVEGSSA